MNEDRIIVRQLRLGPYQNFIYVVADQPTKEAVIFDPAWDLPKIMETISEKKFILKYIINTHSHFDHIEGNSQLSSMTGANILMHEKSLAMKDRGVKNEETLSVGKDLNLQFIHTPGHSPESMCVIVNDLGIVTGDTLFVGECGRVDLPGGDADDLYDSFEILRKLNPKLKIFPGHDYGSSPISTLEGELRSNYTLAKRTREDFVRFMLEP